MDEAMVAAADRTAVWVCSGLALSERFQVGTLTSYARKKGD